jgi:hypothetical protein
MVSTLVFGFGLSTLCISLEKYIKDGKVLAHLGFRLNVLSGPLGLQSVTGPGNTFDLNPKWQIMLPSFGNLSWDMHRIQSPNTNIKVDI